MFRSSLVRSRPSLAAGLGLALLFFAVTAPADQTGAEASRTATTVARIPNSSLPIPSTSIPATTVTIPVTSTTVVENQCGDANGDGSITASDALVALKAAVGGDGNCALDRCDADGNGAISASDSLRILRKAVGEDVPLTCGLL
ncbi:MAG TPA: dockerin type I repeat-containing protein [Candidatus Binatia bacterium]|nr:dockerin type I repeat-containing protein [Candidatus Binatia bacterium]